MKRYFAVALLAAVASTALSDPTPKQDLLVPPASADHFVIVSTAGKHGDEWRWKLPDGSTAYRESILLRGIVWEQDEVAHFNAQGVPERITIRGVTPSGDAAETFTIDNGTARWKSPVDEGQTPASPDTVYNTFGGTFLATDMVVAPFLKAGKKGLALLPSGHATFERSRTLTVAGSGGPKEVRLYFVKGIGQAPFPIWLDEQGKLFGNVSFVSMLPAGYEQNLATMNSAQVAALADLAPAIARQFFTAEARKPVLFRDVKLYDADHQRFIEHEDVYEAGGKIVRVAATGAAVPAGARVIEGRGKTLLPGLWDSHMHLGDDFQALSEVALGVTSIRNPGVVSIDLAQSQARRRRAGTLVAPEAFNSVIVDGKGPLAANGGITVSSLDETLAAVRRIKAAGMIGFKIYGSLNPAWVAPAIRLAHQLGLHVHGHIPAGMRTLDAINDGYDEITHIYFATMQAMPQEVVDKSNTTMRMTGPGRYFKDVDFNSEPTKTVISTMARRHIVLDPTLVVVEGVLTSEAGKLGPSYAPYAGILPPAVERSFKAGALPLPEGTTRDDVRASFRHMVDYVGVMYKAGVPIVAGTDGAGIELVHELELYVEAGLTPAQALSTATIAPARNVHADNRTGSIDVGKEADLLLVDGDPEKNVGDLRHVDEVVLDGALLDGNALRKEAGFSGRPK